MMMIKVIIGILIIAAFMVPPIKPGLEWIKRLPSM